GFTGLPTVGRRCLGDPATQCGIQRGRCPAASRRARRRATTYCARSATSCETLDRRRRSYLCAPAAHVCDARHCRANASLHGMATAAPGKTCPNFEMAFTHDFELP